MARDLSKVSAMLKSMEELDKKWPGINESWTPDDGRSVNVRAASKEEATPCGSGQSDRQEKEHSRTVLRECA